MRLRNRSLIYFALFKPSCLKSTTLVIPSGGLTKKAPIIPKAEPEQLNKKTK